ncbi:hypothetical protein [Weissella confusa]|uniref:hypothetical protein n=1 Tax=Weissella confusa TaxID=1583 RepID=UPI0018F16A19|nr:hypothetical protein [Weissella confusa]MBJ7625141.1 hypothetical protein [Weissella confusa]MBJ7674708.1 hypothetical protein [Weissella confusa]
MKITTEVSGQDMALVLMQNTSPVGETCHDNVSNAKLREAAEIVGSMINDIWRIYYQNKDRQEASAKESSDIAKETLLSIKETLENVSEED